MSGRRLVVLPDAASAPVLLTGPLDVTTAADLRQRLTAELRSGRDSRAGEDFTLDLSGVDAIDMVGVGLLVGMHRLAQRYGRRLVLRNLPVRLVRLLGRTRLHRVLAVEGAGRRAANQRTVGRPAAGQSSDVVQSSDAVQSIDAGQNSLALGSSAPRRAS